MEANKDITDKLKSNGCNVLDVKHIKTYIGEQYGHAGYVVHTNKAKGIVT